MHTKYIVNYWSACQGLYARGGFVQVGCLCPLECLYELSDPVDVSQKCKHKDRNDDDCSQFTSTNVQWPRKRCAQKLPKLPVM